MSTLGGGRSAAAASGGTSLVGPAFNLVGLNPAGLHGQELRQEIAKGYLSVCDPSPGAARVHRDPPQPVYRLRKIQCISQRTWNGLRVWLRQSLAKPETARPLAPRGGRGGQGPRASARNFAPESDKSGQRGLTSGDTKAC